MTQPDPRTLAFSLRLFRTMLATQEMFTVYLGVRLGLYDALRDGDPRTPAELAEAAEVDPRYAREWLEQQATAGILVAVTAPGDADPDRRRYALPATHATVLTESDDPASMAALAVLPVGGIAMALPHLLDAYRTGGRVADEVFGDDWLHGHSGANRALYRHQLAGWIETYLPDLHARLCEPGRRVADVACGVGWSSIALARAYPGLSVTGIDISASAIALATGNAARAGLADRVGFTVGDAAAQHGTKGYDLVCLFDALHELTDPVGVLAACRELCAADGTMLVMDAKVAPAFTAPGDDVEQFQYATSVLHCLPAARSVEGGGHGTVLRPDDVRAMAARAGYAATVVVPVPDRFHRLYRLMA
ncbi:class I SAM-dependent methyltransferase [Micromonospora sp. DT48]|uniref:class I SAM-dependent methyltransferase n=1 Tax=unclassified Micromonospora TaxID=2617518 RepID=UPI0012BD1771|nr:methyltransferase domain-containing protein [Micromonospora sp. CP22]MTK01510.1 methyltransferase domain-containing protein [Micromonospora sp. CP22]